MDREWLILTQTEYCAKQSKPDYPTFYVLTQVLITDRCPKSTMGNLTMWASFITKTIVGIKRNEHTRQQNDLNHSLAA